MRIACCIGIILVGAAVISDGWAAGSGDRSLRAKDLVLEGLGGVAVIVGEIDPELARAGLPEAGLRAHIEGKLRAGGVRVLTHAERMNTPGRPFLFLRVQHVSIASDRYCVHVHLGIQEMSQPARRMIDNPETQYILREMEETKKRKPGFREAVDLLAKMYANGPFAQTWAAGPGMRVLTRAKLQSGVRELLDSALDEFLRAYRAGN